VSEPARAAFLAVPAPAHLARGAGSLQLYEIHMKEFLFLTWRDPKTGTERTTSIG